VSATTRETPNQVSPTSPSESTSSPIGSFGVTYQGIAFSVLYTSQSPVGR
jgi:hypothetical protein